MTPEENTWQDVTVVSGRVRVTAAWKVSERGGIACERLDVIVTPDQPYRHHEPVASFTVQPEAA
jgi:hypothetical protein